MPVTVVYKSKPQMHRIIVIDHDGAEIVHSFGSLELAIKFSESVPTGCGTKYLGPEAHKDVKE